ncbi:hypothetical protein [Roseicyclus persicicus]|uniref:Uncharacterized protein n=1 Tax=Roseicyclus persicicus TaxID=2650661 RepID=A0A7X6GVT6_9RHOB|nr:hypothetical protein [Roseibacterium persicicum]NKX43326.1 hypothetical protein [Roseibacterium persicicum]
MTGWTRHDLPCDITVHAGNFASQPAVFAQLLADCPTLDLGHVEVLRGDPLPRLRARFDAETADEIAAVARVWDTVVLILPAAYAGLECPVRATRILPFLGVWRGRVPRMVADRPAP